MIVSRGFAWAAAGTWILYLLALLLEASDGDAAGMGVVPAVVTGYAMTLLLVPAVPRRSLTELAAVPAIALVLPEVAVSAFSRGVTMGRPVLEIVAVLVALLPVKIERMRRERALGDMPGTGSSFPWSPRPKADIPLRPVAAKAATTAQVIAIPAGTGAKRLGTVQRIPDGMHMGED